MDKNKYFEELILHGYPNKKYIDYDKYNKKILLDDYLIEENINDKLAYKSLKYISNIQIKLNEHKIKNYISGGFALFLYIEDIKKIPRKIIETKDIDLILFYEDKELTNIKIVNNLSNIINLCIKKESNKKIIKLYIVINYNDKKEFNKIIHTLITQNFHLYTYLPDVKNNTYKLCFVKILNNIYIKIIIKFVNDIIKNNVYSYSILNYYYIQNNKKINYYLPIEIIVVKKNNLSNIIGNKIYKYNHPFYVYNEKFLLYNLMYLQYNYIIKNNSTLKRFDNKKNIRDTKRLYYFLYFYCNKYGYDINIILYRFKSSVMLFNKPMFLIKNLDIIDKLFNA